MVSESKAETALRRLPCGSGLCQNQPDWASDTLDGITPKLINDAQSERLSFI